MHIVAPGGHWECGLGPPARKIPRIPALFDRKCRWRWSEPTEELSGSWQMSLSLEEHSKTVENQLFEEETKGWMCRMTLNGAIEKCSDDLTIASTGAIFKQGKEGGRVIYDGSHGIELNPRIRVRDQVRFPTAADGKVVLTECADEGGPYMSIHFDFSGAQRLCGVVEEGQGKKACQIFGIAASSAKSILADKAQARRRMYESQGKLAVRRSRTKVTARDRPVKVLEEIVWLNKVLATG